MGRIPEKTTQLKKSNEGIQPQCSVPYYRILEYGRAPGFKIPLPAVYGPLVFPVVDCLSDFENFQR